MDHISGTAPALYGTIGHVSGHGTDYEPKCELLFGVRNDGYNFSIHLSFDHVSYSTLFSVKKKKKSLRDVSYSMSPGLLYDMELGAPAKSAWYCEGMDYTMWVRLYSIYLPF